MRRRVLLPERYRAQYLFRTFYGAWIEQYLPFATFRPILIVPVLGHE